MLNGQPRFTKMEMGKLRSIFVTKNAPVIQGTCAEIACCERNCADSRNCTKIVLHNFAIF